jgi:hypothetical protein
MSSTLVGTKLTLEYYTMLERLARGKRPSLFRLFAATRTKLFTPLIPERRKIKLQIVRLLNIVFRPGPDCPHNSGYSRPVQKHRRLLRHPGSQDLPLLQPERQIFERISSQIREHSLRRQSQENFGGRRNMVGSLPANQGSLTEGEGSLQLTSSLRQVVL